ncbi:MAG: N-acetylmuramic acid 6-phosphate etherase [Candidatus Eremiobacteraeota bacterium]|nr:N-acetylmuramic acid 6-phosphate etherase [Candidatus Eremiobacteraeota bacterium]
MMDGPLPLTESANPRTAGLDELDTAPLVRLLIEEQQQAIDAVLEQSDVVAGVVETITARLRAGGRLHYVGAGTSGRLAFLDASEAPPTFGTPPELVCAHIAGGPAALTRAVEGAEDNGDAAANEFREHVGPNDVVIGLSASGSAPYVIAALITASSSGAWTIAVTNTPESKVSAVADQSIVLATGPEPLTGSTRLKAGTAQKLFLNTISTATMVRLGKVYDNLMVDVVATNQKLRQRAIRLVMQLAAVSEPEAATLLFQAGGSVKVAVVMERRKLDAVNARRRLVDSGGSLRKSL